MTHTRRILAGTALLCAAVFMVFSAGCISSGSEAQTLTLAGSTTVLPVAQAVAEVYMDTHPAADIQISGGGSGVGVTAAREKTADLGMLSRDLKSSEKETAAFTEYIIGRDGIAIVAHASNPVAALTTEQIREIYLGNITNWKEVGGADMEIVLIGRDSSSGTREFFTESVLNKQDASKTMQEFNSNGAVAKAVAQTPGAIGYISLEYLDDTLKAFTINGVAPSVSNVLNGSYTINRPLLLISNGEPSGLAKAFIEYILSDEGQQIIKNKGFVPVA